MVEKWNAMVMSVMSKVKNAFADERGDVNVVAIVLLIAVAVVLALLLKDELTDLIEDLMGDISDKAGEILE